MNSSIILEHFRYAYYFCNSKTHCAYSENKTVTFSELNAVWEKKFQKFLENHKKKMKKKWKSQKSTWS